jgi:hypothetical protein
VEQFVRQNNSSSTSTEAEIEFLDHILQGLFGLGLKLEYCLSVLDDSPGQARVGLEGLISGFDDLTEPIRDEILRLHRSNRLAIIEDE